MSIDETGAPKPLHRNAFCAAGHADVSLRDAERWLVRAHESGEIRLIDAGREPGADLPRRWRASWGQGSSAVRAALVVSRGADDGNTFLVYAEAARPWSIRDQVTPVQKLGMLEAGLRDSRGVYSLTEQNPLVGLEDVDFLVHTFEEGMRDSPVLVYSGDVGRPLPPELLRFRNATRGLCGLLPADDSVRDRVNALLPPRRRIPARAARLYLPPWWVEHAEDPVIPQDRFNRPGAWRELVDTVLRVSTWRAGGAIRMAGEAWQALLFDPMHDRRVTEDTRGGALRWLPAPDDGGARVLRNRLSAAAQQENVARDQAESAAEVLAERHAGAERLRAQEQRAVRSRRRLAELTVRLRRERDEADEQLRSGSVPATWRAARDAELESELYAAELDEAEDELILLRHRVAALQRVVRADDQDSVPSGAPNTDTDTDTDTDADTAGGRPAATPACFADLLTAVRRDLPALRIGPQVEPSALDGHRRSAQWLRRTWNVLILLDSYARDRAAATDHGRLDLRGFAHYVRAHGGERGISASSIASGETEMVVNTPRFRNARTFPVPAEVDAAGHAFFGAHVKIDRSGGVAPRLHYLDDTRGDTAAVHIGYLGPHLPSPETN
ncbi:hypothetical protein [Saccharopolyspora gloriosae]|uniref:hypothetical protein n=1 Tax=Saccharopolyspora gloriosae TaxID=455344 RepID=UPI001FB7D44D|nr:hypothetical protein [Saccharopolyspora gloriosae]